MVNVAVEYVPAVNSSVPPAPVLVYPLATADVVKTEQADEDVEPALTVVTPLGQPEHCGCDTIGCVRNFVR